MSIFFSDDREAEIVEHNASCLETYLGMRAPTVPVFRASALFANLTLRGLDPNLLMNEQDLRLVGFTEPEEEST
jgi:hypothetical protein